MPPVDRLASADALTRSVFLRGLPPSALAAIAEVTESRQYQPGEVLVRYGDTSSSLLLVTDGLTAVTAEAPWMPGRPALAWIKPGECIGESGMITGKPRTATVTAASHVRALCVPQAPFMQLMRQHPDITLHFARLLASRLEEGLQQRAAHHRRSQLVVLMVADGEDGVPLAQAIAASGEGVVQVHSNCHLRHVASGDALSRLADTAGHTDRLLARTDLAIIEQPIEAGDGSTRSLMQQASLVVLSPGADTPENRARLSALAEPQSPMMVATTLAAEDAGAVIDTLGRPNEIAVFIPTTIDVDQEIDAAPYLDRAAQLFGQCFGGATMHEADGVWKSEELGLVGERIWIVRTSCGHEALNTHLEAVTTFMGQLKQELRQEAMAMQLNGRLILL